MPTDDDQAFTNRFKQSLDQAAHNLDAGTLQRLQAVRKQAIARHRQPRINVWIPAGAMAAGLTVIVAGLMWFTLPASLAPTDIEDLELLATPEGIEFYSDLDFYDWLATQSDAG